jgi:hypothetical protein
MPSVDRNTVAIDQQRADLFARGGFRTFSSSRSNRYVALSGLKKVVDAWLVTVL